MKYLYDENGITFIIKGKVINIFKNDKLFPIFYKTVKNARSDKEISLLVAKYFLKGEKEND